MAFEKLLLAEQKAVLQSMKLILKENYIADWEFPLRLGITREQLRQVIAEWPLLPDDNDEYISDRIRALAINNSLNEVLHGVGVSDAVWARWLEEPPEEVKRIFHTWRKHKGWSSTASGD